MKELQERTRERKNVPAGLLGGGGIWRIGLDHIDLVGDSGTLHNADNGESSNNDGGELHSEEG